MIIKSKTYELSNNMTIQQKVKLYKIKELVYSKSTGRNGAHLSPLRPFFVRKNLDVRDMEGEMSHV